MTTGELINLIGSDGIREALLNRWLVADNDTGFLTLNTGGGKLLELENACRCDCGSLTCECEVSAPSTQSTVMPMREAFAGFGLPHPGGGSPTGAPPPMTPRPLAQQTGAPVKPVTGPDSKNPEIGDDTTVVDNGQAYTGKVATVGQDGRYRVSFGNNKPPMDRDYGPDELRVVGKAVPHA